MDDQAERTVIISSRELCDHAVLSRKRNELSFKRDLLLRSGAKDGDLHLKAIDDELAMVEEKLKPIAEKLSVADLLTLVPHRREIDELSAKINAYSRAELDAAIRGKSGVAYELMKARAALVKNNFERREDIARLTVHLNAIPRKEAESLRLLIEEGTGPDIDVSFLPKEKQQELVNLTSRIGRQCCVFAGSMSVDKKKVESAELRAADEIQRIVGGRPVWVEASGAAEFDANEKAIAQLLAKLQAKNAEKQARDLNEEEVVYLDKVQTDYLAALQKRSELARGIDLAETVKVYRKVIHAQPEDGY